MFVVADDPICFFEDITESLKHVGQLKYWNFLRRALNLINEVDLARFWGTVFRFCFMASS